VGDVWHWVCTRLEEYRLHLQLKVLERRQKNSESWHLWCGRDFLNTFMSADASDTRGHRTRQLQVNVVTKRTNTGSVIM